MILIFSDTDDPSTDMVINWLLHVKARFIRINPEDKVIVRDFELTKKKLDFTLCVRNKLISYSSIRSIWYRKGMFNLEGFVSGTKNKSLAFFLEKEGQSLSEFIIKLLLQHPKCIGNFKGTINKLEALFLANSVGLQTPHTYIVKTKKEIEKLKIKHRSLITKSIFEAIPVRIGGQTICLPTLKVNKITHVPDKFYYSLIQNEIKKDFEIRAFYVQGEIYAAAMFTQNNKQTKIDFRNYDHSKPTRVIPYKLPKIIITKLNRIMKELKLNTGSFDLIYSQGEYVFLEVNPVGQFGMISYPCNYYLEQLIAKKLYE